MRLSLCCRSCRSHGELPCTTGLGKSFAGSCSRAALTDAALVDLTMLSCAQAGARIVQLLHWATLHGAAATVYCPAGTRCGPCPPVRALRQGVSCAYGVAGALAGISQAMIQARHTP